MYVSKCQSCLVTFKESSEGAYSVRGQTRFIAFMFLLSNFSKALLSSHSKTRSPTLLYVFTAHYLRSALRIGWLDFDMRLGV
jgi:hypothetical protein